MTALMVTAHLEGAISIPSRPLALDALLAYAVAIRDHITPASIPEEVVQIEIPVMREPEGKFHLCSHSVCTIEKSENRWQNRRPVIDKAQKMGSFQRMQINGGSSKGYRIPLEAWHLGHDEMRWWAIGDPEPITDLLGLISHLGKKRAGGLGRVAEWTVSSCDSWGDGFPVVLNGQPLRPLPVDWPGLSDDVIVEKCTITYPYPQRLNPDLHLCAIPRFLC